MREGGCEGGEDVKVRQGWGKSSTSHASNKLVHSSLSSHPPSFLPPSSPPYSLTSLLPGSTSLGQVLAGSLASTTAKREGEDGEGRGEVQETGHGTAYWRTTNADWWSQ